MPRGRRPVDLDRLRRLRSEGLSLRAIAAALGVSAPTVRRHLGPAEPPAPAPDPADREARRRRAAAVEADWRRLVAHERRSPRSCPA